MKAHDLNLLLIIKSAQQVADASLFESDCLALGQPLEVGPNNGRPIFCADFSFFYFLIYLLAWLGSSRSNLHPGQLKSIVHYCKLEIKVPVWTLCIFLLETFK